MMRSLGFVLLIAAAIAAVPAKAEISSYVIVQPDGTLSVGGRPVRLFGIMMPPTERQCRTFERPVECGSRAALQLGFKIGSNFVHCQEVAEAADGVTIAVCRLEQEDLSAWMLLNGWALAGADAPYEYRQYERLAQAQGRGVWGMPVDNIQRRGRLPGGAPNPSAGVGAATLGTTASSLGTTTSSLGTTTSSLGSHAGAARR